MAQTARYRVGLIGAGRAGVPRARAFDRHPRCELVAIADTDADNLELATRRFDVRGYASWDDMLAQEQLDIGVAVLPVRPNADAVVALARAGVRSIFCEKPLSGNLADADRMVEETATRRIPLVCGVVISSHADYQKAYGLVAGGEIGEVVRINLYEGNGQMGTHGLNLARRFAGRAAPRLAIGFVSGNADADSEDEHEDGIAGYGNLGGYISVANGIEVFSNFRAPHHYFRGIEIMGTEGVIFNHNNTGLGLRLFAARDPESPKSWEALEEVCDTFLPVSTAERGYDGDGWRDPGETMLGIVDEMVAQLDDGTAIGATTGDDMRHALEMAIALRQSARRGFIAVEMPLAERDIVMLPEKSRWLYKKTLMGSEAYMKQLADHKRD